MSKATETNGIPDLAAECKKWERQCAELMQERDRLRAELARKETECDLYRKSLFHYLCKDYTPPDFTKEEVFAHLDDKPNILEVIAEMEQRLEKRA